jgi:hypothetical protein
MVSLIRIIEVRLEANREMAVLKLVLAVAPSTQSAGLGFRAPKRVSQFPVA